LSRLARISRIRRAGVFHTGAWFERGHPLGEFKRPFKSFSFAGLPGREVWRFHAGLNRFQLRALLANALKLLDGLSELLPAAFGEFAKLSLTLFACEHILERFREHRLRHRIVRLSLESGEKLLLRGEGSRRTSSLVIHIIVVPS
jgi:hypothetical protein